MYQLFPNGNLIAIHEAFEKDDMNVMSYNSLISTIPKAWKHILMGNTMQNNKDSSISKYASFCSQTKPTRFYYKQLVSNDVALFSIYDKWIARMNMSFTYEEFLKQFEKIKCITNHSKLRSLQYRCLCLALVFNTDLYKWKITDNNLCTFVRFVTTHQKLWNIFLLNVKRQTRSLTML